MTTTHARATCCWCQSPLIQSHGRWWCQQKDCRTKQLESAIVFKRKRGKIGQQWTDHHFWFAPLPSQAEFERVKAPRKLWGGAAGPGKSFGARRLAYRRALKLAGLNVLLLRKTYKELERTHIKEMRREANELAFEWIESRREARFRNGSVIECGHLEDEQAVQTYLSAEYDLIIVDEAVQIPPDPLLELMSRARTSNPAVQADGGAEVWLVTNPGGPSHALLRDLFISHTPDTDRYPALARVYDPAQWVYFPATLDDNPYLDPQYELLSLTGLRRARYEQLRHGDWDVAEGQFFEMFSARTHTRVVKPFPGAEWVEAFDWGYTQPSCWGAFFHVGDHHWHCAKCLTWTKHEPEAAAVLIKDARKALGYKRPRYAVADPKIFSEDRGESIAETFRRHGVDFQRAINRRADTERHMGWPRLAAWFRVDPVQQLPWLTFDPNECRYLIRTIPALLADAHNPEDVDTDLDDHGADMTRYFVMSRPPIRSASAPAVRPPLVSFSMNWFRQADKAAREGRGVVA